MRALAIAAMAALTLIIATDSHAGNDNAPLGTNLCGVIDYSSELHFLNHTKRARPWISQCEGCGWGEGPALTLDEHGWVTSLEANQTADLIFGTFPKYKYGKYRVTFEGTGTLRAWCTAAEQTFSTSPAIIEVPDTGERGCGYAILRVVETDPTDYIKNIEIVHVDDTARYDSGEIFYEQFVENWKPYRFLRFMDWAHTNNSINGDWSERPVPEDYSYGVKKGVPLEIMIELCNQTGCYPWFCIPHLADDEYIRKNAEMVRDNLDPSMRIYLEHSNEIWNGIFKEQFRHTIEQGQAQGLQGDGSQWDAQFRYHAKRTAEIVKIWTEVLGSRNRIIGVLAVGGSASHMTKAGMDYLVQNDMDQYIDAIGRAPYVGSGKSYSTVDEAIAILEQELAPKMEGVKEIADLATSYGKRLVAYEGGQHLWQFGQSFSEVGEAAQADPRMKEWVKKYHTAWKNNGGDEFAVFSSGGGFWGQIPWGTPPMEAPKYAGRYEWIQENTKWWTDKPIDWTGIAEPGAYRVVPMNRTTARGRLFTIQGRALRGSKGTASTLVLDPVKKGLLIRRGGMLE